MSAPRSKAGRVLEDDLVLGVLARAAGGLTAMEIARQIGALWYCTPDSEKPYARKPDHKDVFRVLRRLGKAGKACPAKGSPVWWHASKVSP